MEHGNHDADMPQKLRATTDERIENIRRTLKSLEDTRNTAGVCIGMVATQITYGGLKDLLAEYDRLKAIAEAVADPEPHR
jgi:hypothetical protein